MGKEYDFSKGKRSAVLKVPAGKTRITIRLDSDLVEWFRKHAEELGGANYQTLVNQALRSCVRGDVESLEKTLRRVLREELPEAKGA